MRHDVTFPLYRRGRRDLQSGLPGLADPLPVRSGADDQDQRARRDQHAGPGQAGEGARSCRPRPPKSTATRRSIRRRRTTGATSIRSARAPATTRASAAPRRCSSTTAASTACEIKVARIFNTYGPRMHPNDGRVVSNFIVQALQGRADHHLRRRPADALVLLRRRPGRRPGAPDGHGATTSPARSTSAIRSSSPCCELAELVIELTGSALRARLPRPAGDDPRSASPTSAAPSPCWAGGRRRRCARA